MGVSSVNTISDLGSLVGPFLPEQIVRVEGYHTFGDQGGGCFYFAASPSSGAVREDGGTVIQSSTVTGVWRRIYSGSLNVRWFGAKANGEDDSAAFQKALDSITLLYPSEDAGGTELLIPFGNYVVNKTLFIRRQMILRGVSGAGRNSGTLISFAENIDGLMIQPPAGTYQGGAWTIVRDLSLRCVKENTSMPGALPEDEAPGLTGHGIVLKARARIVDCQIDGFPYDGINIDTRTPASNADNFEIHNCRMINNGRHGLFTKGENSNAGRIIGSSATNNRVWGFYESSFLGNTYIGCHCDRNGTKEAAATRGGGYKTAGAVACNLVVGCYAEDNQENEFFMPTLVVGGKITNFSTSNRAGIISVNSIYNLRQNGPVVHQVLKVKRMEALKLPSTSFDQHSISDDSYDTILVDLTEGPMQLILPAPKAVVGHKYTIRRVDGSPTPGQNVWELWVKAQDNSLVERDVYVHLTKRNCTLMLLAGSDSYTIVDYFDGSTLDTGLTFSH